jgi:hypothetical protein
LLFHFSHLAGGAVAEIGGFAGSQCRIVDLLRLFLAPPIAVHGRAEPN